MKRYSPLAWELAHHGEFAKHRDRGVRITVVTLTRHDPRSPNLNTVVGHGSTEVEAMQDAARQLDRIFGKDFQP